MIGWFVGRSQVGTNLCLYMAELPNAMGWGVLFAYLADFIAVDKNFGTEGATTGMRVCVRVRACVRACVHACACVRACCVWCTDTAWCLWCPTC